MKDESKVGQKVKWNSHGGEAHGTVVKKVTNPTTIKSHKVAASKDGPGVHREDGGGQTRRAQAGRPEQGVKAGRRTSARQPPIEEGWRRPDQGYLPANIGRIGGVHVTDWRQDASGSIDRAFPGEGKTSVAALIEALDAAGYEGFYDVELFCDDGSFDISIPDSLWKFPPPRSCGAPPEYAGAEGRPARLSLARDTRLARPIRAPVAG